MALDAMPLYRRLENAADTWPDRLALVYRGAPLTLGRVREQMNRLASSLQQALALDPGQCLAVHLPNLPQFLIAAHAAWKLGAVVALLDPAGDAGALAATPARVVLTSPAGYAAVLAAQPASTVEHVLVASDQDYAPLWAKLRRTLLRPPGPAVNWRQAPRFVYPYPNMVLHNPLPDPVAVGPADPALLLGTDTYTHRDLGARLVPAPAPDAPAAAVSAAPLWQLAGLITALGHLYAGDTLLL